MRTGILLLLLLFVCSAASLHINVTVDQYSFDGGEIKTTLWTSKGVVLVLTSSGTLYRTEDGSSWDSVLTDIDQVYQYSFDESALVAWSSGSEQFYYCANSGVAFQNNSLPSISLYGVGRLSLHPHQRGWALWIIEDPQFALAFVTTDKGANWRKMEGRLFTWSQDPDAPTTIFFQNEQKWCGFSETFSGMEQVLFAKCTGFTPTPLYMWVNQPTEWSIYKHKVAVWGNSRIVGRYPNVWSFDPVNYNLESSGNFIAGNYPYATIDPNFAYVCYVDNTTLRNTGDWKHILKVSATSTSTKTDSEGNTVVVADGFEFNRIGNSSVFIANRLTDNNKVTVVGEIKNGQEFRPEDWMLIKAPTVDMFGNSIDCSIYQSCSLHLYASSTKFTPFYAHTTASGLIVANGNIGTHLGSSHTNAYISDDYGYTWSQLDDEETIFEVGVDGDFVAWAPATRPTDQIWLSVDRGTTRAPWIFTSEAVTVYNITHVPIATSNYRFMIHAIQQHTGNNIIYHVALTVTDKNTPTTTPTITPATTSASSGNNANVNGGGDGEKFSVALFVGVVVGVAVVALVVGFVVGRFSKPVVRVMQKVASYGKNGRQYGTVELSESAPAPASTSIELSSDNNNAPTTGTV